MQYLFTCMWCGFKVFEEVFSESEICPICWFQDSVWWVNEPFDTPYIGNHPNLVNYQAEILKKIPIELTFFSINNISYYRNPLWKPIDINKFNKSHYYYPNWKFEEFRNKYPNHSDYHRKLMIEAQKYNPDEFVHII